VCRSWEGAQRGRQNKLANGNIPHHGHHAQSSNGGWLEARILFFFNELPNFFRSSAKSEFHNCSLGTGCKLVIRQVRKKCIACFAYSIVIIFFVVLLNCRYLSPRISLFVHSPHPTAGQKSK